MDNLRRGSAYADLERLKNFTARYPREHQSQALDFDQTDVFRIQTAALEAGYTNIILMVFDGMDWQTSRAASLYKQNRYSSGRGTGLAFQDDRLVETDYGLICTSPMADILKHDTNSGGIEVW